MVLKNDNEKMSDHSESGSEDAKYDNENEANGSSNDICRDYLRNVCKRGKRCKYRHPNTNETKDLRRTQDYTFCHDYQNNGCRRPNCKFLHCTREEEEFCRQTGQLPVRLQQASMLGVGVGVGVGNSTDALKGSIPICKDNLKGECHRGTTCKFRHVSIAEFEYQLRKAEGRAPVAPVGNTFRDSFDRFDRFDYEHENTKRRRLDRDFPGPDGFNSFERFSPNSRPLSYQLLEDENTMLRRKVEELKKQVADLTATNEVLLEQNARYRVSKSSILHTLNSTGVQPVQATSLNPLNTSLAQQIALNSELVTQQALQQRIVRELAGPAQCSIAAPPSLNTASLSINGPTIVPVSHPQNDLRLQPSVSIQTQSIPQNLAQAQNTSLVSYPIVSQSMRMTASSLAH